VGKKVVQPFLKTKLGSQNWKKKQNDANIVVSHYKTTIVAL
jgi:hypothetical protein